MVQTKRSKDDLKEIVLSNDSNLNLPEVSYPSSYKPQGEVKLGAKSIDNKLATEHQLLEYQKRVTRKESILSSEEIRTLVYETNERRRSLEESILQQKQEYMDRHNAGLQLRQAKERKEAYANKILRENDTQKAMRLAAEEEIKTSRTREIQALVNKCRKEKEDIETFVLQPSNCFNDKYGNATKKVSGETGIDRIISSRPFSTNRYAHRCIVCGYHFQESLSISKIYQHIFDNKDSHMQIAFSQVDEYYNTQIESVRQKHTIEDNPDLRQQKLAKDMEALRKLKGANYR